MAIALKRAKRAEAIAAIKSGKDSDGGNAGAGIFGSEDYDKIPESLKDKKAYEHMTEKDFEYNRELVNMARDNIVIVPSK